MNWNTMVLIVGARGALLIQGKVGSVMANQPCAKRGWYQKLPCHQRSVLANHKGNRKGDRSDSSPR